MIARVKFEGVTESNGTRSVLTDYVDIHVAPDKGLLHAKNIFLGWIGHGTALRGADNGVFHPLMGHGDIKIKSVVEMVGAEEEGMCLTESLSLPATTATQPTSSQTTKKKRARSSVPPAPKAGPKSSSSATSQ